MCYWLRDTHQRLGAGGNNTDLPCWRWNWLRPLPTLIHYTFILVISGAAKCRGEEKKSCLFSLCFLTSFRGRSVCLENPAPSWSRIGSPGFLGESFFLFLLPLLFILIMNWYELAWFSHVTCTVCVGARFCSMQLKNWADDKIIK